MDVCHREVFEHAQPMHPSSGHQMCGTGDDGPARNSFACLSGILEIHNVCCVKYMIPFSVGRGARTDGKIQRCPPQVKGGREIANAEREDACEERCGRE